MKLLLGGALILLQISLNAQQLSIHHYEYLFNLHGQMRVIELDFHNVVSEDVLVEWKLRKESGFYKLNLQAARNAMGMSFQRGETQDTVKIKADQTLYQMISMNAYDELVKQKQFMYNKTTYVWLGEELYTVGEQSMPVIHVRAQIDDTEMWITKSPDWPVVVRMTYNPLGINYELINYH
ncbi:MAG: hypothetical protein CMB80_13040 [Flammeovirgaceae bacterium]|nr:hypothetical protein [Flammeovirgaceae bacterium]MBE60945.1 hypothetical protein [Flammeovirgaceae bacterium]HCX24661.1 hypothetical protein [Cytophagales bacterium]|tara:strand:- start:65 stop:604 length:540 start_codon:yes stop_codon:yes gene_type:complete